MMILGMAGAVWIGVPEALLQAVNRKRKIRIDGNLFM
jgi:hypothetical protein